MSTSPALTQNNFVSTYACQQLCPFVQIEHSSSATRGRIVVACKDIFKGQIIANQHPYAYLVNQIYTKQKCHFCFQSKIKGSDDVDDDDQVTTVLLRCSACLQAHYCDKRCQAKDW